MAMRGANVNYIVKVAGEIDKQFATLKEARERAKWFITGKEIGKINSSVEIVKQQITEKTLKVKTERLTGTVDQIFGGV